METPPSSFDPLVEKIETYATTSIELAKLKLLESGIQVTTNVVARLAVIAMISFFGILLNLGLGLLLGKWLGEIYLGFLVLAGFYLLLAIILHFFLHRWIKRPLSDFILSRIIQ